MTKKQPPDLFKEELLEYLRLQKEAKNTLLLLDLGSFPLVIKITPLAHHSQPLVYYKIPKLQREYEFRILPNKPQQSSLHEKFPPDP